MRALPSVPIMVTPVHRNVLLSVLGATGLVCSAILGGWWGLLLFLLSIGQIITVVEDLMEKRNARLPHLERTLVVEQIGDRDLEVVRVLRRYADLTYVEAVASLGSRTAVVRFRADKGPQSVVHAFESAGATVRWAEAFEDAR